MAGKKLLRKKSLVIKSLICDSGSSSHLSLMPIKQSQQEVPYISVNTMMLKGTQQIPKVCEPQHAVRRPQWEELTDEAAVADISKKIQAESCYAKLCQKEILRLFCPPLCCGRKVFSTFQTCMGLLSFVDF